MALFASRRKLVGIRRVSTAGLHRLSRLCGSCHVLVLKSALRSDCYERALTDCERPGHPRSPDDLGFINCPGGLVNA